RTIPPHSTPRIDSGVRRRSRRVSRRFGRLLREAASGSVSASGGRGASGRLRECRASLKTSTSKHPPALPQATTQHIENAPLPARLALLAQPAQGTFDHSGRPAHIENSFRRPSL